MTDREPVPAGESRRTDPPSTGAYRADAVVTVVLFVVAGLAVPAVLLLSYLFAALGNYGCGNPTNATSCSGSSALWPLVGEFVLGVGLIVFGAILAARVRNRRPLGWVVALGALLAVVLVGVIGAFVALNVS